MRALVSTWRVEENDKKEKRAEVDYGKQKMNEKI
jgi:hypothetical protein